MNVNISAASLLVLHLQILPGIGIAGGDGREDILPLLRRHARTDRVDEGVAEDRHQIVVLKNRALDLLRQLFALGRIDGALVLVELAVEILHADPIARVEAAALEMAFVPERPAPGDAHAVEDHLHAGPLLETALQALEEDPALHGLEPGANADLAK